MSRWTVGMRDAFSNSLYEIAKKDKRVILLTADTGAVCHDEFRKHLETQYINVGIAEQNLVGIAAGLSMSGKIVYIYAIIPFVTMRCYEQIRVDLCCMNLPVTVVGIGAGYDYNTLGPTHHGTEDIALMRVLPGMSIFSPSDSVMASAFAKVCYETPGPKYVRLDRTGFPLVYDRKKKDFKTGLEVLKNGNNIYIIATGRMVYTALKVAQRLSKMSIDAGVIDLYRIKPINTEILLNTITKVDYLVTLEEHFVTGGIGSAIVEILADKDKNYHIMRLGISDKFCRDYGTREYLQKLNKLDSDIIVESISRWVTK